MAMAERMFALEDVGTRLKVLSVTPSTHTDKFGGSSTSMMVQVIGVGLFEPQTVIEKMPFMTVECDHNDDAAFLEQPWTEDIDAVETAAGIHLLYRSA